MPDPEKSMTIIQYILLCFNVITWLIAIIVIGLCFWVRFESESQDMVEQLQIERVYTGLYIIIVTAVVLIVVGFVSCMGTFQKNRRLLAINILIQMMLFILGLAGAAVLLDNSTFKSTVHGVIKDIMISLINLHPSSSKATDILIQIQEGVGCCGGDSYNDYINMNRAIPTECRDTVTGNTFFYGCADEITWYLEPRAQWIAGLTLVLCAKKVINAVLSTILIHLIVEVDNEK